MRFRVVVAMILLSGTAFGQYNFYFGNIHCHTSYSDGNKDSVASGYYYPGQDFYYVKGSYHMDFLGISDHNHYTSNNNPGMHVADYARGLYQADTANNNGTFVCMYGFEYGVINNGGHVVVYGIPGLVGWESGSGGWGATNNYDIFNSKLDYAGLWSIVNTYPKAFATLAHPQPLDYADLSGAATYNTAADNAIVGTAMRNGLANSTTTDYSDPTPATLYEWNFLAMLARGYHLGPTVDQDNHYTTFGRVNKMRTGVLATTLNRDSIIAAYKAMRFYATEDWNTQVTFTVNGNYMGSDFSTNSNSSIYVSVNDPDFPGTPGDGINKIEIYYGTPGSGINATVLASNTSSTTLNYIHPTIGTNLYYYYAKITQVDGDIMWTSPIWVYRSTTPLPLDITRFNGQRINEVVKLNWTTAQETNVDRFEIERSLDGISYQLLGTVISKFHTTSLPTDYDFYDQAPMNGTSFYRLKEFKTDGSFAYSDVVAIKFDKPVISIVRVNPNPAINTLNISCNAIEAGTITCTLFNADGRRVKESSQYFTTGSNNIVQDVSALPAGTYYIVLSRPNQRVAEGRFVKQ